VPLRPDTTSTAHFMVFDEPTATLPDDELPRLLGVVRLVATPRDRRALHGPPADRSLRDRGERHDIAQRQATSTRCPYGRSPGPDPSMCSSVANPANWQGVRRLDPPGDDNALEVRGPPSTAVSRGGTPRRHMTRVKASGSGVPTHADNGGEVQGGLGGAVAGWFCRCWRVSGVRRGVRRRPPWSGVGAGCRRRSAAVLRFGELWRHVVHGQPSCEVATIRLVPRDSFCGENAKRLANWAPRLRPIWLARSCCRTCAPGRSCRPESERADLRS
jgi:hypothetical protein